MYTGYDYEEYCCRYLKSKGYKHIKQTPRAKDHGIDIIAQKHRKKYAFQCKYYGKKVGNRAVQEAYTGCSYYDCDIPVVITNSSFTKNAIEEAQTLGVKLIDSVDIRRKHNIFLLIVVAVVLIGLLYAVMPDSITKIIDNLIGNIFDDYRSALIVLAVFLMLAALGIRKAFKSLNCSRTEDDGSEEDGSTKEDNSEEEYDSTDEADSTEDEDGEVEDEIIK